MNAFVFCLALWLTYYLIVMFVDNGCFRNVGTDGA